MKVYKWLLLLVVAVTAARADSDAVLAMTLRAQTDFDRVEAAPFPDVKDTIRCAQSQAELLPASAPREVPLIRFRKGYCELLQATFSPNKTAYHQAAQDFAQALATWQNRGTEPVSSGLQVLSAIARLHAGADVDTRKSIKAGLADTLNRATCPASIMSGRLCQELVATGNAWLGWMAAQEGDTAAAQRAFQGLPDLGWQSWAAARQASQARRYEEAVGNFRKAVETWSLNQKYPKPGSLYVLGPKPDLPGALAELGAAEYLAGDHRRAVTTLDAAVKARPEDARSIFNRGLAKDAQGDAEGALMDYQKASRTAFANPDEPFAAGQAHLYRGVWHFRRQAWRQAEDEFSTALNLDPGPVLRPDAVAWRHMAAVASGACLSGRELTESLRQASPFFPRTDAEKLLAACRREPETISSRN